MSRDRSSRTGCRLQRTAHWFKTTIPAAIASTMSDLQAEDEPRPTMDAPVQQQDPGRQRSDVPPDDGSQEADLAIEPRQTIPREVQHRCIKRQGLWFSC